MERRRERNNKKVSRDSPLRELDTITEESKVTVETQSRGMFVRVEKIGAEPVRMQLYKDNQKVMEGIVSKNSVAQGMGTAMALAEDWRRKHYKTGGRKQ